MNIKIIFNILNKLIHHYNRPFTWDSDIAYNYPVFINSYKINGTHDIKNIYKLLDIII